MKAAVSPEPFIAPRNKKSGLQAAAHVPYSPNMLFIFTAS
jgi:hypothetical protein